MYQFFPCVSDLGPGEPAEEEGVHGQPGAEVRGAAGGSGQLAAASRDPGGRAGPPHRTARRPPGRAELRICIHFIRIRIQHFRLNTDPDPDPIRIQGFNDQKLRNKLQPKKIIFLKSKATIYLSLGLHKKRPSYRRSLQLSKEAIQHIKA
jgi:hypothetical protein